MNILDYVSHKQICKELGIADSTGHDVRRQNLSRYMCGARSAFMQQLPDDVFIKIVQLVSEYAKEVKLDTIKRMT